MLIRALVLALAVYASARGCCLAQQLDTRVVRTIRELYDSFADSTISHVEVGSALLVVTPGAEWPSVVLVDRNITVSAMQPDGAPTAYTYAAIDWQGAYNLYQLAANVWVTFRQLEVSNVKVALGMTDRPIRMSPGAFVMYDSCVVRRIAAIPSELGYANSLATPRWGEGKQNGTFSASGPPFCYNTPRVPGAPQCYLRALYWQSLVTALPSDTTLAFRDILMGGYVMLVRESYVVVDREASTECLRRLSAATCVEQALLAAEQEAKSDAGGANSTGLVVPEWVLGNKNLMPSPAPSSAAEPASAPAAGSPGGSGGDGSPDSTVLGLAIGIPCGLAAVGLAVAGVLLLRRRRAAANAKRAGGGGLEGGGTKELQAAEGPGTGPHGDGDDLDSSSRPAAQRAGGAKGALGGAVGAAAGERGAGGKSVSFSVPAAAGTATTSVTPSTTAGSQRVGTGAGGSAASGSGLGDGAGTAFLPLPPEVLASTSLGSASLSATKSGAPSTDGASRQGAASLAAGPEPAPVRAAPGQGSASGPATMWLGPRQPAPEPASLDESWLPRPGGAMTDGRPEDISTLSTDAFMSVLGGAHGEHRGSDGALAADTPGEEGVGPQLALWPVEALASSAAAVAAIRSVTAGAGGLQPRVSGCGSRDGAAPEDGEHGAGEVEETPGGPELSPAEVTQVIVAELDAMARRLRSSLRDGQELRLQEVIGMGAFAVVLRGEWQGLPVAVKAITFSATSEHRHRALREAALCQALRHEHIVATYDVRIEPLGGLATSSGQGSGATPVAGAATGGAGPDGAEPAAAAGQAAGQVAAAPAEVGAAGPGLAVATGPAAVVAQRGSPAESAGGAGGVAKGGGSGGSPAATLVLDWRLLLVQELADGGTLRQLYGSAPTIWPDPATGAGVNVRAVLQLALGVARGVAYLHAKGIVHGDLSPANILLRRDPSTPSGFTAKLADLGLSVMMPHARSHVSDLRQGTPYYICPRMLKVSRVSRESDMFPLGVLLWELWWGRPVVRRATVRASSAATRLDPAFPSFPTALPALPPAATGAPAAADVPLVEGSGSAGGSSGAQSRKALPYGAYGSVYDIQTAYSKLCFGCIQEEPRVRPGSAEVAERLAGLVTAAERLWAA